MDFNGEAPDVSNITLIPCRICGRTFAEPTLVKHEVVCKKNAAKRRKVFDSGKMRALGSDIPLNKVLKPNQKPKPEKPKKSNWRQQHEEFIAAIRAAKGGNEGPPPRSSIPPSECLIC
ncbi:PREDICTED: zinc finger C2HC domain-containing protein 1A-like [Priapulus caudatus]|uniref:Zinc finger C2HC domain-containing protein 1A-like n=1 Tax=Priapulus caudatus TaxID=37621 RepID=A0ABM1DSF6_PRICU|nr:PREDICTED: zinc finger C2HC domain-containing protein 1A-like [Priapulus caudatus]